MAVKSESYPAYLNEFRTLKLKGVIRDVHKLTTDELIIIKKEIEKLLTYGDQNR
ncbi:hypothetical protein [Vulcanibacillus modesticaldus]|uniref:hypothetical protein n=1 Tax=Vulcanibacillus modesticaldus TaxID=337097 RepID=UPI00159F0CFD|nr:hypothetical protein [Vulcanibacillus modesticaldus]